jgi:hypothetical protein
MLMQPAQLTRDAKVAAAMICALAGNMVALIACPAQIHPVPASLHRGRAFEIRAQATAKCGWNGIHVVVSPL